VHRTIKLKFMEAKQAKEYYKYRNTKRKPYKTNSAIWYNKKYRQRRLNSNYVNINIKRNQQTKKATTLYRLNLKNKISIVS